MVTEEQKKRLMELAGRISSAARKKPRMESELAFIELLDEKQDAIIDYLECLNGLIVGLPAEETT